MTVPPEKAPKKTKETRQTPEERQRLLRYNQMMYGPTSGERRPALKKKADLGAPYLQHPKFQSLLAAFKRGAAFRFDVTDKGKAYTIATEEGQITFGGRVLFYARPANRYEDHLLLDRETALQQQSIDAFVHLLFAVLRSLPELELPALSHLQGRFYLAGETLDVGIAATGPNLLLGSFKHGRPLAQGRS